VAKWRCTVCDYIYDEVGGDPERGASPGTPFGDLPTDWVCPDCRVEKEFYERI
jgi:rubredoxin